MLPWLALAAMMGAGGEPSPCPSAPYAVDASTHSYGADSESEALDLYLPHGASRAPIVVYIHGGAWVGGDKSDYVNLGEAFARCGIAAAILNYPLAPQTPAAGQAGKLADALAWLRTHAPQARYDPARTFLIGHSAGAQLAWFALVDGLASRSSVAGVIALGAVGINPSSDVTTLAPQYQGIYDPAFGSDRSQWARFDVKPKLRGTEPPSLVIHGANDDMAPEAISRQLYEQLKAAGDAVQYLQPAGRGHWDMIEALARPGDATMGQIERFVLGKTVE
ncbi:MAG TPA: alpha/beta hydrolase [Candidatus Eremiobacteraceae bacterium]|nr:alpha/beta hydrolase [Candidatus Eremiobacteraceae bacterium]